MISDNTRYLWVQSASAAMREDNTRGGMTGIALSAAADVGKRGGAGVMDSCRHGLMVWTMR